MLISRDKKAAEGIGFGWREPRMFSYGKRQLLACSGCTYADANGFLGFGTGKACYTGFKLRGKGEGISI